ncbi:glycine zipper domain-containing protein [Phenylobacterium sp.]|uniref:glycine zipper domain-containing protein n=1 Tax=Phenylobacterium sp. TaxID=1871053 RepID=UPI00121E3974|nr:glycine zipper domain-containing protein [Phenylobacterium sp.]THD55087.1 MAG: hypothetical protein E8A12_16260 [Phenylobacterium sp.]
MKTPLKFGMASILALAIAAPAMAQYQTAPQYPAQQYPRDPQDQPPPGPSYQPSQQYQDQQQQYQQDQQNYEARKDAYDARRDNYEASRAGYEQARADYEHRRAAWERARADYDARYGYGAYIRIYGPAPDWDARRWAVYGPPPAPYVDAYGRPAAAYAPVVTCRNDHSSATAGAVIGALAGAALGSNIAAGGHRTDGAILGGVVGAGVGGSVGAAHDRYRCDSRGPYYSYSDTIAYREDRDFRSGRYDYAYYSRMRCRLAPAVVDSYGQDVRYVRVCPDGDGRYRITG